MGTSRRERIIATALDILGAEPRGLSTGELLAKVKAKLNDEKRGVHTALMNYVKQADSALYQPARGWFKAKDSQCDEQPPPVRSEEVRERVAEAVFYEPFADWLVEGPESCTKAITVGGSMMKDKFGTPDVVGVFRPSYDDIISFPMEIVSAEIKVSEDSLITAFGQACSYKLFSHKSYIVIPHTAPQADIDRLDSLCMIFGIGLVLFNSTSPANPNFQIRTRAGRHDPDMFYVNQKLRLIGDKLLR